MLIYVDRFILWRIKKITICVLDKNITNFDPLEKKLHNQTDTSVHWLEIVVEWVMKSWPFWIKNLPYIPHIMNDSNGRFGDKKEWTLLSVLCSLWGIYARENLQCVFSFTMTSPGLPVCNVLILLQISLNTLFNYLKNVGTYKK